MYTRKDFKTKKSLKEAIAHGDVVTVYQPNDLFGNPKGSPTYTGSVVLEGPHYPKPHTWYAQARLVNGSIVEVR